MNDIEKVLNSHEIRLTPMRMLIYRFLVTQRSASALNDIENAFDKMDRTTLYRTLKTFEEKGIVHKIEDGTGVIKYAICEENCECEVGNDLHLHFHCNNCNETVCLTEYEIPQINLPDGYVTEEINLVVKGICDKCNKPR